MKILPPHRIGDTESLARSGVYIMVGAREMFYLKELHAKGYSIRAIAYITGHDRKTVRKYINAQLYPRYKHRPKKPS